MGEPPPEPAPRGVLVENVEAIAGLEQEALRRRSLGERASDAIVGLIGTMGFVLGHVVAIGAWVAVNLGAVPGVRPFDPFPFGILTLIVSGEGVFLTLFVLISQNRMTRISDQRAHLNLQISLLSEREATRMLQLIQAIAGKLEVAGDDDELRQLSENTEISTLARELHKTLPEDK